MKKGDGRTFLRYQRVYRRLRARILAGYYEIGAQIETEPQLAKLFQVSLITVRQATSILQDEGLIDRQQGRGTFVPESVRGRLKVLCVVGLRMGANLRSRVGSYHLDLVTLSDSETAKMGFEFETVWLDHSDRARLEPFLDKDKLSEYWGFVFIACGPSHGVLEQVHATRRRYVVIGANPPAQFRRVWLDLDEAIRLSLRLFDTPPLIFGLENFRPSVEAILREQGQKAPQVYLPYVAGQDSFEATGYQRVLQLHREGMDLSRILFLDDIVAQGATRALLKAGYSERRVKLAVICGKQEMIPLGLPVMYVVHDTAEEVRQAFEILRLPPSTDDEARIAWRSDFRIVVEPN